MYHIWIFTCDEPYSSGMGLVGADSEEEAKSFVEEYSHLGYTSFSVEKEIPCLLSSKKGIIETRFYIE